MESLSKGEMMRTNEDPILLENKENDQKNYWYR